MVLPDDVVRKIMDNAQQHPGYQLMVDLEAQRVWDDEEDVVAEFEIDPYRRHSLLNGLDEIGLTLHHESDISAFEAQRGKHGGILIG